MRAGVTRSPLTYLPKGNKSVKPIASRDKIHSVCREICNKGIVHEPSIAVESARTQTPVEACVQSTHLHLQRAVHVVVKARRGMRKVTVREFDLFVPVKR